MAKMSPRPQEQRNPRQNYGGTSQRNPPATGGVNAAPPKVRDVSTCKPMGNNPQQQVSMKRRS